MPTTDHRFLKNNKNIGFKLFLPEDYAKRDRDSFALLLFLHGINKRGDDLHLLNNYGLLKIVEQLKDYPYIVVAPQCPADSNWIENRAIILEVLDEVVSKYRVDRNQIYLTGFSMGASGVWDLAAKTKDIFTAAVPIAGGYRTEEAVNLTHMPIWAFHGEQDDTVPIAKSDAMVDAIMEKGGDIRYTRYPELDHSHTVMYETYSNPELYRWLGNHKKAVK